MDACHLDGPYALRNNAVCLGKGVEHGLCCPGFIHASVVVLLQHQMCVHPHAQQARRLCIEQYGLVSDSYLCCQFWPEVFPVASSARE